MTDTDKVVAVSEILYAAFMPDCAGLVRRGALTGTTAPEVVVELVAATIKGAGIRRFTENAERYESGKLQNIFSHAVYAGVIKTCEAKEFARRAEGGEGYAGNGHHWAQRLTSAAVESARTARLFERVAAR